MNDVHAPGPPPDAAYHRNCNAVDLPGCIHPVDLGRVALLLLLHEAAARGSCTLDGIARVWPDRTYIALDVGRFGSASCGERWLACIIVRFVVPYSRYLKWWTEWYIVVGNECGVAYVVRPCVYLAVVSVPAGGVDRWTCCTAAY